MRSSQPRMKTIVPRHGGFDWLQGERAPLLGTISQPDKGLRGQPLSTDARVKRDSRWAARNIALV
jgi:hypothetical protein